jgi:hypothetical protein
MCLIYIYIYIYIHFKMFTVFGYETQDWTEQNVQVVVRMATLTQETVVITLQFSMWKGGLDSFYVIMIMMMMIIIVSSITFIKYLVSGDLCCVYLLFVVLSWWAGSIVWDCDILVLRLWKYHLYWRRDSVWISPCSSPSSTFSFICYFHQLQCFVMCEF